MCDSNYHSNSIHFIQEELSANVVWKVTNYLLFISNEILYYVEQFNPYHAKFNNLNFHPLEVVFRDRDPQLQVGETYSYILNWDKTFANLDFKHSFHYQ